MEATPSSSSRTSRQTSSNSRGRRDLHQALADVKINFIVDCSPLLGPQLADMIKLVVAGQTPEKRIVTEETTFTQEQAKETLPDRQH